MSNERTWLPAVLWSVGIVAALTLFFLIADCGGRIVSTAIGDTGALSSIEYGIRELQPAISDERAKRLTAIFYNAGQRHNIDPLLLVAIAFKESSLSEAVENRRKRGELGEYGLMQTHGVALNFRPADCNHHLLPVKGRMGVNASKAYCQVETGAAYLAEARRKCGGTWARWIAAYGMGRCPSDSYAKTTRPVQRAYKYYKQIGGRNWQ